MEIGPVTVAETELFLQQAADLWSDGEYDAFVEYIANNPEAGDIIPDTGGVRKVRWRRQGMGKRGGVRVIYFYHNTLITAVSVDDVCEVSACGFVAAR
jgi:hypothetical protein